MVYKDVYSVSEVVSSLNCGFGLQLERGIYLAPSQYEAGFTSVAHTDEDIEKTIEAARAVFKEI